MEMRRLGRSGLSVSALSFGTMTFSGEGAYGAMGSSQGDEARKLIDVCLEAGVNLFDTADVYSHGGAEKILGEAIKGRRDQVLIATKAFARMGPGPNDIGLSRQHLMQACEDSLRRLGTGWIDLYQVHNFDSLVPIDETLRALDNLVRSGKVRYLGCSNQSGWHLMKALGLSDQLGLDRYVSQQINYSLVSRDAESELLPLGLDEGVGVLVWSPLHFGLLSGKFRRGAPPPETTRLNGFDAPGYIDQERLYCIVEQMDKIASARQVSCAQVALNWLLAKPGVDSVIVGARNEAQLRDNLASASWQMEADEVKRLDEVSRLPEAYPYWHQHKWGLERNPPLSSFRSGTFRKA